ncbi:MAG: hypothetical protein ABJB97_12715, partial [Acidobacteriota bacterium]
MFLSQPEAAEEQNRWWVYHLPKLAQRSNRSRLESVENVSRVGVLKAERRRAQCAPHESTQRARGGGGSGAVVGAVGS